jgi:transcriptional regulator with XRE-family HTH domain
MLHYKLEDDPKYCAARAEILTDLHDKIQALCQLHGTNVSRLSCDIGKSHSYLYQVFKGEMGLSTKTLSDIATKFGLQVEVNFIDRKIPLEDIIGE